MQVRACLRFVRSANRSVVVERRASQKLLEDLPALTAVQRARDEGVFLADLLLVSVEALRRCAEDGKVQVEDQAPVPASGLVLLGGEDKGGDPLAPLPSDPHSLQPSPGELGAALLVVALPRNVDDVVDPERELHLLRALSEAAPGVQARQAFGDVLQRVVVPPLLPIPGDELVPDRGID